MKSNFVIYSASAGSGKTFQLAVKYISICLKGNENTFKEILAITFTNKAAGEMKSRILNNIYKLSIDDQSEKFRPFKQEIIYETQLKHEEVTEKSKKLLSAILHDFSAFQVLTIDKFFVKVFKSFAADLLISPARKPSIDEKYVKALAMDMVINKIGLDQDLTDFFNSYLNLYFNEMNNGSDTVNTDSDPTKYLNKIIDKISKDASDELLEHLKKVSYVEFRDKIAGLRELKERSIDELKSLNEHIKDIFNKYDITEKDTKRGTLYRLFFEKLSKDAIDIKDCLSKVQDINPDSIIDNFNKSALPRIQNDGSFQESLSNSIRKINSCLKQIAFLEDIVNSSSLLIILRDAHEGIQQLSHEENIILLNEISRIIFEHIRNERGEFVFEKIGVRYKHIFIDEFQDTSTRQWENLKPLLSQILSVNGTVHIIGDPKQSIYGFRNANSGLMIDLMSEKYNTPGIPVKPSKVSLDRNYRSSKTIVDFNNKIFTGIRDEISGIQTSYSDIIQKENSQDEGYVEIKRLGRESYKENTLTYVADTIFQKIKNGYQMRDIAILLRSSSNAKYLANELINYPFEDNFSIKITSSDSFLLKENTYVKIVINTLRVIYDVNDDKSAFNLLYDLLKEDLLKCSESEHDFFKKYMVEKQNIFEYISSHQTNKTEDQREELNSFKKIYQLKSLAVDELVKHITKFYAFDQKSDVFLSSFIDFVYDYGETVQSRDIGRFLSHWDTVVSEDMTINTSANSDSIKIMTIHKAKGLQWPVVLLPFFDYQTFSPGEEIIALEEEEYGLKTAIVKLTKNRQWPDRYEPIRQNFVNNQLSEAINLMYVAMTRAEKEMHISYQLESSGAQISNTLDKVLGRTFSDNSNGDTFVIGKSSEVSNPDPTAEDGGFETKTETAEWRDLLTIAPVYSAFNQEKIAQGSRMHAMISACYTLEDFEKKLSVLKKEDALYKPFKNLVEGIRNSEELSDFFKSEKVMNERKIVADGKFYVPDAIALNGNKIQLLEYKTGRKREEHKDQLKHYIALIEKAGYSVSKAFLVYLGDEKAELVNVFH